MLEYIVCNDLGCSIDYVFATTDEAFAKAYVAYFKKGVIVCELAYWGKMFIIAVEI